MKKTPPTPAPKKAVAAGKPAPKAKPPAKKAAAPAKKATPSKVAKPVAKPAAKPVTPAPKKVAPPPPPVARAPGAPASKPAPVAKVPAPEPAKPTLPAKGSAKALAAAAAAAVAAALAAPPTAPRIPTLSKTVPTATKSGAIYYDSHMHTPLCKHAWGEPEEYAAQGIKAGLKGIIFTCHCPMPEGFWPTVRMSNSEFDTYLALVKRAADAYKGKLDVRLGLESEYFPGMEKWIEALHQRADFDYILGAVHWQSKEYLGKYENGTIESFRRTYFEHLAASAETGLYDCLAHPDLVKNYHPDSWCFAIVKNTTAGALDRIAKTGVAMELNTSGLNKSYSEMNPGNEMLRMMAERKIPIVLGSDAHRAPRVGEHFVTAL
ncbi:MAG: histidinol-phosphatase, partial [Prosthecobacter sp.]|nr:histidinol-phosphatase [Prosthecobacter sp.]